MNLDIVGLTESPRAPWYVRIAGAALAPWWPGPRLVPPEPDGPSDIVIHGASAGEVAAARALVPHLQGLGRCSISTRTASGLAAGAALWAPPDGPSAARAWLRHHQVRCLLLVEAELWPNLLDAAAHEGVKVAVVQARLGPGTKRLLARPWGRALAALVTAWAAGSDTDARAFIDAGIPAARVRSCGVLKWPAVPVQGGNLHSSRANETPAGREDGKPAFVLGSIHPGEVAPLARLLAGGPLDPARIPWRLHPRHEQAAARVTQEASRALPAGRFSVEARFGGLQEAYARAGAAFVGGGLVGRGVHNLLEPASYGLRPLAWLTAGDPFGLGAALRAQGGLIDLQGLAGADPGPVQWRGYAAFREQMDGTAATVQFLRSAGVLPNDRGVDEGSGASDSIDAAAAGAVREGSGG